MWLEPFVLKFKVKPLMLLELVLTLISGGPTRFITPPPAVRIAPNSALPPLDPSSTFSVPKSIVAPTFVPFAEKEKEKETPTPVVELKSKEVTKVEQLKKKKNEKKKEDAA